LRDVTHPYRKLEQRIPEDIAILNARADADGVNRQTPPTAIIAEHHGYGRSGNEVYKDIKVLEAIGKLAAWPPGQLKYKGYAVMPAAEIDEPMIQIALEIMAAERAIKNITDNVRQLGKLALESDEHGSLFVVSHMIINLENLEGSLVPFKDRLRQLGGVGMKLARLSDQN